VERFIQEVQSSVANEVPLEANVEGSAVDPEVL
jgi:hypothetical protein